MKNLFLSILIIISWILEILLALEIRDFVHTFIAVVALIEMFAVFYRSGKESKNKGGN